MERQEVRALYRRVGYMFRPTQCSSYTTTIQSKQLTLGELIQKRQESYNNKSLCMPFEVPKIELRIKTPKELDAEIQEIITSMHATIDLNRFARLINIALSEKYNIQRIKERRPEIIFQLFETYVKLISSHEELTILQVEDMNKFINYFVEFKQLKKAQLVMKYLILKSPRVLEKYDVSTTRNYLKLNCGACHELWYTNYKIFDFNNTTLDKLVKYSLDNKIGYWDVEIIHSLGYSGRIRSLEDYILKKWGISLCDRAQVNTTNEAPESEVLEAIINGFFYRDKRMFRAIKILNEFVNVYPDLNLKITFWKTFMNNCIKEWDEKVDQKGVVIVEYWETMKRWYTVHNRRIPFNINFLKVMRTCFKKNNNLVLATDIFQNCFHNFYFCATRMNDSELNVIKEYQNFILSRLIEKKGFSNALTFINDHCFSLENKRQLMNYYHGRKEHKLKKMTRNENLEKTYDDMVEEDFIIGKLW
ncbi:hypothetical protein KAFR_0B03970 [Kazachstania africana CBS 2517]|uniref:ATPase expression protein 2, mitochondrial n=1 Tax=Kazachstania africana (strain ATCC 22294 / BCRC 22015 / CBS 2517 / CECT 1963 / NBRC 1671 / NRRL Y-8276) TaxID=1071382 RepID=H2AQP3_KAZAF|nr:hypothetical protein KAFR_0B03970 [Kazachstania africana CBS 2517]CCF56693.1 hypothetical protein KAFR_0B03970 [Kazachstania africana CBS 2517]